MNWRKRLLIIRSGGEKRRARIFKKRIRKKEGERKKTDLLGGSRLSQ